MRSIFCSWSQSRDRWSSAPHLRHAFANLGALGQSFAKWPVWLQRRHSMWSRLGGSVQSTALWSGDPQLRQANLLRSRCLVQSRARWPTSEQLTHLISTRSIMTRSCLQLFAMWPISVALVSPLHCTNEMNGTYLRSWHTWGSYDHTRNQHLQGVQDSLLVMQASVRSSGYGEVQGRRRT